MFFYSNFANTQNNFVKPKEIKNSNWEVCRVYSKLEKDLKEKILWPFKFYQNVRHEKNDTKVFFCSFTLKTFFCSRTLCSIFRTKRWSCNLLFNSHTIIFTILTVKIANRLFGHLQR